MKSQNKVSIIAVGIIIIWTALIYSNTFDNTFHYDDERVLIFNPAIKNISNYGFSIFKSQHVIGLRPVLDASFALNYHFGEFNVFGYHLVNLIIHILVCILVYFIISRVYFHSYRLKSTGGKAGCAYSLFPLLSTMLFATHPINTQTVNYISARSTSMCVCFMLISLYLFIKFLDMIFAPQTEERKIETGNSSSSFYCWFLIIICFIGAFVMFPLAVGSRKMAVILPFLLLGYDLYFYKHKEGKGKGGAHSRLFKQRIKSIILRFRLYHMPFWLIIIAGLIKMSGSGSMSLATSLQINLVTACKGYVYYLQLLFAPIDLSLEHFFIVPEHFMQFSHMVSFCIVAVVIALAVLLVKKYRLISFSIFLYFIMPMASSSVLLINVGSLTTIIAEHRIYASAIGFCASITLVLFGVSRMLAGCGAQKPVNNENGNKSADDVILPFYKSEQFFQCALIVPILLYFSYATFKRNFDWKSELTLWTSAVEHYPKNPRSRYNLGLEYSKIGKWNEAMAQYNESLKYNPNDFQTHNNLGVSYMQTGELDLAIVSFRNAALLKDRYPDAIFNLAVALENRGRFEEALRAYNKALELKPDNIIAIYNIGNIFMMKKQYDKALPMFRNLVEFTRTKEFYELNRFEVFEEFYKSNINKLILDNIEMLKIKSLNNLGIVDMQSGNVDKALANFNKALQIKYEEANVHYNIGWARYKQGAMDTAKKEFEIAVKLDSNMVEARNYLGIIYSNEGKLDDAFLEFAAAVKINPEYVEAHKNLGVTCLKKGDTKRAFIHLSKTIELNPNQPDAAKIRKVLKGLKP